MKNVENFLNNLLRENDTVVLGVSGGPDSMCLLHVLNNIKDKLKLNIICAHVNHNLRKESVEEAKFVEKFCLDNNIIFEFMKINKYTNNKFSENEAREKRYAFFKRVLDKYQAKYLFTAHHGNDLEETILMRIVRGSNLKGYIGIPLISNYDKYLLIRPLLYLTKNDILEYMHNNRYEFVTDKSNEDEKYTRNRYRKRVLPLLEQEDKNVHLKFLKFSEELKDYHDYINKIVDDKYSKLVNNEKIDIHELLKEDEFIQARIIERLVEIIQKDYLFDINTEQLNNIINLVNNNKNGIINLANGFIARKSYNYLTIEKEEKVKDYEFLLSDDLVINQKHHFEFLNSSNVKSNFVLRLDSNEIKLPLIVRTKRNGDKIKIKNLNGTKKVKDVFIDSKIDSKNRSTYPILTDSNDNILWIPGIKKSIFDKEKSEKCDIIIKYTEENYE